MVSQNGNGVKKRLETGAAPEKAPSFPSLMKEELLSAPVARQRLGSFGRLSHRGLSTDTGFVFVLFFFRDR